MALLFVFNGLVFTLIIEDDHLNLREFITISDTLIFIKPDT